MRERSGAKKFWRAIADWADAILASQARRRAPRNPHRLSLSSERLEDRRLLDASPAMPLEAIAPGYLAEQWTPFSLSTMYVVDVGPDGASQTIPMSLAAGPSAALPLGSRAIYVSTSGNDANDGSLANPLASIQEAIDRALPGATVIVRDGTYDGPLASVRGGTSAQRITVQAENPGNVVITGGPGSSYVLHVGHPFLTIEGLVFDGEFRERDLVRVSSNGDHLVFRNNEVRNGRRDGIDLGDNSKTVGANFNFLDNVLIVGSQIHHLLWHIGDNQPADAHGIVAGGVRDFTVRDTEVFFVSGDALQLQDGGWDRVLVESVNFHNGPLPEDTAGFTAGTNPGEDGIDTKQDIDIVTRGRIVIRNSEFSGWSGLLSVGNPAALNIKERVEAIVEGNIFHDNEVALRLRGPTDTNAGALVTVMNNVLWGNSRAVRYEFNIENLHLWNNTFGAGNGQHFDVREGAGDDFQVLNNLFFGETKPGEAGDPSNLAAGAEDFLDSANHDYRLVGTSSAVDAGIELADVLIDRDHVARPQGVGYDVGAYEYNPLATGPVAARVEMTLGLGSASADLPGTVEVLPGSETWLHEWDSFFVDLWLSTVNSDRVGVESACVGLAYDPRYFTATSVLFGDAFPANQVKFIDDATGAVDITAQTISPEIVGASGHVLFARVLFNPTGSDNVPQDLGEAEWITAASAPWVELVGRVTSGVELASVGLVRAELGSPAETELYAVPYDLNDDGRIDFGDLSVFAGAFLKNVGASAATFKADFDHSGRVGFGDFNLLASNFLKRRGGGAAIVLPGNFPDDWRPSPLVVESGLASPAPAAVLAGQSLIVPPDFSTPAPAGAVEHHRHVNKFGLPIETEPADEWPFWLQLSASEPADAREAGNLADARTGGRDEPGIDPETADDLFSTWGRSSHFTST